MPNFGAALTGEVVTARDTGRPPALLTQRERDEALSAGAAEMIFRGLNPHTVAAYGKQWRLFTKWCEKQRRTAAPVHQHTMIEYVHYLEGLPLPPDRQRDRVKGVRYRPAPPTLWLWYSAVRFVHRMGDPPLPWECGDRLTSAMIAYCVGMMDAGWRPHRAPRAFPTDVTRMVDALDLSCPKALRDRAILLTNFYTAARASDLATYRIRDVGRFPLGIVLSLARSKTNKNKQVGRKIETRELFANSTHPQYCAVQAIDAWLAWLRDQGVTSGALFRPLSKPGKYSKGALLRGHRDAPDYKIDGTSLACVVQDAALAAELPNAEDYTCHSLRRGRATQQRELGADPLDIARTYGWAPGGSINVYLEEANRQNVDAVGAKGML